MTSIGLATMIERAREAALTGDPAAFPEHLRAIQSLDRSGSAPGHELDLLSIVAAARSADLAEVDRMLPSIGHLAVADWQRVRRWLLSAPEMQLPPYVEFVRTLERRMRQQVKVPPARRWTPTIGLLLAGALASLGVLAWRLSPSDPTDDAKIAIESVLAADAAGFLHRLPESWRDRLGTAGRELAQHDTATQWKETEQAIDALSGALLAASKSADAERIAQELVGPSARGSDLVRASKGALEWRDCPWIQVSKWRDDGALDWTPSEDARFAWRCALRHMPLAAWLPGWFSTSWRCDPLRDDTVLVTRSTVDESRATILVLIGTKDWAVPVSRDGRRWPPIAIGQQWRIVEPALDPAACTSDRARSIQTSISRNVASVAGWIRRVAEGSNDPTPPVSEAPWWTR